jgi:hypothetical protein
MLTARERGELRGLRVVPENPGPEFQPGPEVPVAWKERMRRLVNQLKERRSWRMR